MIGTLMGIIRLVAVVCLLLIVLAVAFILIVFITSIIASVLQYCADLVSRRKK